MNNTNFEIIKKALNRNAEVFIVDNEYNTQIRALQNPDRLTFEYRDDDGHETSFEIGADEIQHLNFVVESGEIVITSNEGYTTRIQFLSPAAEIIREAKSLAAGEEPPKFYIDRGNSDAASKYSNNMDDLSIKEVVQEDNDDETQGPR